MPGTVIGTSLKNGFPGSFARMGDQVIRTRPVASGSDDIPFGHAVILTSTGEATKADATATAATFAGVAVRRVKQPGSYKEEAVAAYKAYDAADIIERGSVNVVCNVGSPAPGGAVYLRTKANESITGGVVGGFEASSDTTNSVQLTNCAWGTGKDADGVAELVILTRQGV